jgi:uncharacterized protein (TIGR03067 family)
MNSLLIGLAIVVAAPAPKESPKKDAQSILGDWVPVMVVVGGMKEDMPAGLLFTLGKDGKVTMREGKDAKPEEINFTLDPKHDPPHITLTEPNMEDNTLLGIYKLDGDTLTVCLVLGKDRPTVFASPPKSGFILITLKRPVKD